MQKVKYPKILFSKNGGGISFTYTWNEYQKPYGSMFLATSPELEMALYTTCLMVRYMLLLLSYSWIIMYRPNVKCHVTLTGRDVYITTYNKTVGNNVMVASSFPDWRV